MQIMLGLTTTTTQKQHTYTHMKNIHLLMEYLWKGSIFLCLFVQNLSFDYGDGFQSAFIALGFLNAAFLKKHKTFLLCKCMFLLKHNLF